MCCGVCRRTYLALILGCAKASKSDAAYQLYKSLRAQGMEVDGRSGSELITSLCHANQVGLCRDQCGLLIPTCTGEIGAREYLERVWMS